MGGGGGGGPVVPAGPLVPTPLKCHDIVLSDYTLRREC